MDFLRNLIKRFRKLDKKKQAYVVIVFSIVLVMFWAFISAGVITCNFNRAQVKDSQDGQKVDAFGVIITETKQGKKYFALSYQ